MTLAGATSRVPMRVLVLAPQGRDAPLICGVLAAAGIEAEACATVAELASRMRDGAAAALITEEALTDGFADLADVLAGQPSWSDFPVILLTAGDYSLRDRRWLTFFFSDISQRRASEEHLRLVINELSHRVKNTLAVIQVIADQTFKPGGDIESSRQVFGGRLRALAETHIPDLDPYLRALAAAANQDAPPGWCVLPRLIEGVARRGRGELGRCERWPRSTRT
jgi:hypothetical protein